MSKEAMKLAIEFLSDHQIGGYVIEALEEALAKQEQSEPDYKTLAIQLQQQRTWVGLTIENIVALFPNEFLHSTYDTEKLISDVRIVEAKLKEKNT